MGNVNDAIKVALADYMRNTYSVDVDYVDSWEDTTVSTGYCDSCYYEYAVEVFYYNSEGERVRWVYSDSFADLIRDL